MKAVAVKFGEQWLGVKDIQKLESTGGVSEAAIWFQNCVSWWIQFHSQNKEHKEKRIKKKMYV